MAKTEQQDLFKAQTTWFHVFKAMFEGGDIAKLKPFAAIVYLTIKAYTNFITGRSFPSIETIAEKSGISIPQVKRCLVTLETEGYITKEKRGKNNVYTLREKIEFTDQQGRPAAVATWDYLPSTIEAARAELRNFQMTGNNDGKIINIERAVFNIQIGDNNTQTNFNNDIKKDIEKIQVTSPELAQILKDLNSL